MEKAVAVYRRIDRFARALKTRDEPRTLDQLRVDVAMDLLLGGTNGKVGVQAEVFLYMDMNTYLGLNNDPVEMAGHGHIPAQFCDIDHHVDWAFGGPTNVKDLIVYCRFEHKLKDEPGWCRTLDDEGTLIVTTPTGRSYPSKPEPLHEPRALPLNDDDTEPPS